MKKGHHKRPASGPKGGGGKAGAPKALPTYYEQQVRDYVPELGSLIDKLNKETAVIFRRKPVSAIDIKGATDDIDYIIQTLNDKVRREGLPEPRFVTEYKKTLIDLRSRLKALPPTPPLDPPIESISHRVEFVVTITGSVSPSWTLARFKGPAPNGSLASVSRLRTHTLSIVIGDPGSPQAQSARSANAIGTAIRALNGPGLVAP